MWVGFSATGEHVLQLPLGRGGPLSRIHVEGTEIQIPGPTGSHVNTVTQVPADTFPDTQLETQHEFVPTQP